MGKSAMQVRRGDERSAGDGRRHRLISRTVDDSGAVTLTYDVLWATGGKTLEVEVIPPGQARIDTGFASPATPIRRHDGG